MSKTSRRKFSSEFKSKVCIGAIKEQQTIESLAKKYDLHPTQINLWKKEFLRHSASVFEKEDKGSGQDNERLIQALYAQIGELKVANDFLKKSCCKTSFRTPYADRKRSSPAQCRAPVQSATG
jgi:transposase